MREGQVKHAPFFRPANSASAPSVRHLMPGAWRRLKGRNLLSSIRRGPHPMRLGIRRGPLLCCKFVRTRIGRFQSCSFPANSERSASTTNMHYRTCSRSRQRGRRRVCTRPRSFQRPLRTACLRSPYSAFSVAPSMRMELMRSPTRRACTTSRPSTVSPNTVYSLSNSGCSEREK